MSEQPKISVIMSVHNGERFLSEAIDSIMVQSCKDFEFFITDDGSSDQTSTILARYAERYPQIRLFQNKKCKGLPASLNIMAKCAQGKYLARMDADDIAHQNRFEHQVKVMDGEPNIDVCFTGVNLMSEDGRMICARRVPSSFKTILALLPYVNYFTHPTAMLRKSSFKKVGGYNELFLLGQDWELWQRMVANGMRLRIINDTLLNYRINIHGSSMKLSYSSAKSGAFFEANILIQNGQRVRAISLLPELSAYECFEFFVRFLMPHSLFISLVKLRAKYSKTSPQQRLLEQENDKD